MALKIKLYDPKETQGYGQVDLPAGKYLFKVTEAPEQGTAKSGRGYFTTRLIVVDGQFANTKSTVLWNLPEPGDANDHYLRNFWKDLCKAWPCYDEATESLDEKKLAGLQFHATLAYKEGSDFPQFSSYRWVTAGSGAPAGVATPAPEAPAPEKPGKFATP
jgi:hypothetical protein